MGLGLVGFRARVFGFSPVSRVTCDYESIPGQESDASEKPQAQTICGVRIRPVMFKEDQRRPMLCGSDYAYANGTKKTDNQ